MSFEQALQTAAFSQNSEKTFIDKLLGKEDTDKIRSLIKKEELTRSELLELLNILSGTNSKLVNLDKWERYLLLKFFVWIREFVKYIEFMHDEIENTASRENICVCGGRIDSKISHPTISDLCTCEEKKPVFVVTDQAKRFYHINRVMMEHNTKFLIDLYLNIANTSMSLGATAVLEMLSNKFEINYKNGQGLLSDTSKPAVKA